MGSIRITTKKQVYTLESLLVRKKRTLKHRLEVIFYSRTRALQYKEDI